MADNKAEGKSFLITGGASGLGASYVETFLGLGAKNIAILDVAEQAGIALAERLNKIDPGKVMFVRCDVSKETDIEQAFIEVVTKFKQIDVLINNAGIMVDAPQTWRLACDVNWQGLVSFTMKAINHMSKDQGGAGGTVINISSTAALCKLPFLPIYCGSKMAVLHFSQCIAVDPFFDRTGVRILTMCFGPTDTPLLQNMEKRTYNPEIGQAFLDAVAEMPNEYQKVASAVNAFLQMYETGAPGSIWYSGDNKPGRDITKNVNAAFDTFEKTIIL